MNTLDQRILIPASPDAVWSYISDLANNPRWQTDCRSISFLTTQHGGQGCRWRSTSTSGHDLVIEIITWYDRLGYEYRIVDGVAYHDNRGRIRLQEIAEGTIVQWTFNYEPGGVLGGLRNSLSTRRQIEGVMIDSLKKLWKVITQTAGEGHRDAKSLMRDAPDVEARSQYKPRHPSVLQEKLTQTPPGGTPMIPVIPEPPITQEDTRPRQPVPVESSQVSTSEIPAVPPGEPDFAMDIPQAPETSEPRFAPPRETPPGTVPTFRGDQRTEEDLPAVTTTAPGQEEVSLESPAPIEPTRSAEFKEQVSKLDTAHLSVFEVFGLPKPSDTQQMQAIQTTEETSSGVLSEPPIMPTDTQSTQGVSGVQTKAPARAGRRLAARRKLVNLRRPL